MASLRLPWIPIYVLSKNHFSFGVAFVFYDSWAYSEIHTYRMSDLISRQNVLMMFRFTRFMLVSAQHHHDKVKSLRMQPPRGLRGLQPLVDMNGIPLFTATPKFIAPRVLLTTDTSESGVYKVLKFYPDMASATSAVANRKLIEEALQLPLANYPIIEGCGGGICALQDEHITQCANVTISHVKKLAEIVSILRSKQLVHGDLRLPNIIFHGDSYVSLIDCDSAGKVGSCFFPSTARAQAFGSRASGYVVGDKEIPEEFDVYCLADILQCFQDKDLDRYMLKENYAKVQKALDSHKDKEYALESLNHAVIRQKYLDFRRIDSRICAYLEKNEHDSESEKSSSKKRKTG